jgi:GTP pyrophosphokinase
MGQIEKAWLVAEAAHHGQRYDIFPYTYHLKLVVTTASFMIRKAEMHPKNEQRFIMGCILHDILEDTDLKYSQLENEFGETVACIVFDVTDGVGKTRKERKDVMYKKIQTSKYHDISLLVKICDRIANINFSIHHSIHKYKMYQKESSEFYTNLRKEETNPTLILAWKQLDKLVPSEVVKLYQKN